MSVVFKTQALRGKCNLVNTLGINEIFEKKNKTTQNHDHEKNNHSDAHFLYKDNIPIAKRKK